MKVLITGANGQVGHELQRHAPDSSVNVIACDRQQLDITHANDVHTLFATEKPDLCINAAAYTAVDLAEEEQKIAFACNRDAAANLAIACEERHIPLIHISTDYVFNGRANLPYCEQDPVSPLGVYGFSKEAGEQEVRNHCTRHIILRTSWVFSAHGKNFVKTMLRLAAERETLHVVSDQVGCPTAAADIAKTIWCIASQLKTATWGTYHYCGSPQTNWHDFAEEIITQARLHRTLQVKKVLAIPTDSYPTPAQRPENSSLNCALIEQQFHIAPSDWRQSLQGVIKELYL
ncbi:MAG: dTDP-4-dehydrorhamnose reductase [Mariprofundaceae bacterium]